MECCMLLHFQQQKTVSFRVKHDRPQNHILLISYNHQIELHDHTQLLKELPMDYGPNGISSPHKNKEYSMRIAFNPILVGVLFTYQKKAIKELYCIVRKKRKKKLCCLFTSSQKLKKVSVKTVNNISSNNKK